MKYICLILPVSLLFFCGFSMAPSERSYLPGAEQCRVILLSQGNPERKLQKYPDSPLSERGKDEVFAFSKRLAHLKIQAIYSSSHVRAIETAEILAKPHSAEVIADSLLHFHNPDSVRWFHAFYPKKKKDAMRQEEVREGVLAYVKKVSKKHLGETVLIVAKQSVLKSLRAALGGTVYQDLTELSVQDTVSVLGDGKILVLEK